LPDIAAWSAETALRTRSQRVRARALNRVGFARLISMMKRALAWSALLPPRGGRKHRETFWLRRDFPPEPVKRCLGIAAFAKVYPMSARPEQKDNRRFVLQSS